MVEGTVQKYLKEVTLLGQTFVKDDKLTIEQLLKNRGASVVSFRSVRGRRRDREEGQRLRRRGRGAGCGRSALNPTSDSSAPNSAIIGAGVPASLRSAATSGRRRFGLRAAARGPTSDGGLTVSSVSMIATGSPEAARHDIPQATPVFRRVLLKLSGEALMGDDAYGINRATIERMVREIGAISALGVEIAIVIGGGNIFRGVALGAAGMDRATADYMGMLATVMNSLALQDALRQVGVERAGAVGAQDRAGGRTVYPAEGACATSKRARS